MEHQDLQIMSYFSRYQFLKKAFQFILSISIFSFLLYSSWVSFLFHSHNFYYPAFPFQLFSQTMDRKYVFLLCNGIVVFVVKSSGLMEFSPVETGIRGEFLMSNENAMHPISGLSEAKASALHGGFELEYIPSPANVVIVKEEQTEDGFSITEEGKEDKASEANGFLITQEQEEQSLFFLPPAEEEEEEEEEESGSLSTEELNRIFDDFIRRKKEEIRLEAQQLVIVK